MTFSKMECKLCVILVPFIILRDIRDNGLEILFHSYKLHMTDREKLRCT